MIESKREIRKSRNKRIMSNMMLLHFFLKEGGAVYNPKIIKRQNKVISFCSDCIEIEDEKMNIDNIIQLSSTFERTLEIKRESNERFTEDMILFNEDDFIFDFDDEEIRSKNSKRYDYIQKETILFNAISSILIRLGYQLVYKVDDKIQKKSTKRRIDGIVDLHDKVYFVEDNEKAINDFIKLNILNF